MPELPDVKQTDVQPTAEPTDNAEITNAPQNYTAPRPVNGEVPAGFSGVSELNPITGKPADNEGGYNPVIPEIDRPPQTGFMQSLLPAARQDSVVGAVVNKLYQDGTSPIMNVYNRWKFDTPVDDPVASAKKDGLSDDEAKAFASVKNMQQYENTKNYIYDQRSDNQKLSNLSTGGKVGAFAAGNLDFIGVGEGVKALEAAGILKKTTGILSSAGRGAAEFGGTVTAQEPALQSLHPDKPVQDSEDRIKGIIGATLLGSVLGASVGTYRTIGDAVRGERPEISPEFINKQAADNFTRDQSPQRNMMDGLQDSVEAMQKHFSDRGVDLNDVFNEAKPTDFNDVHPEADTSGRTHASMTDSINAIKDLAEAEDKRPIKPDSAEIVTTDTATPGDVQSDNAMPDEQKGSVGSMQNPDFHVGSTAETEGLKFSEGKAGKFERFMAKTIASPWLSDDPVLQTLLQHHSKEAKVTIKKLANVSQMLAQSEAGSTVAPGGTIESNVKRTERSMMSGMMYREKELHAEMIDEARKGGTQITRGLRSQMLADLREHTGVALHSGDTSPLPQAEKLAQFYRQTVYKPILDRLVAGGHLPEGITPENADSYFRQIWNAGEISRRPNDFIKMTADWYEQTQAKKAELQSKIGALNDAMTAAGRQAAKSEKSAEGRKTTADKTAAAMKEIDRIGKFLDGRNGIGVSIRDRAAARLDEALQHIESLKGFLEDAKTGKNIALHENLDDITQHLKDLFESRKADFTDKKQFTKALSDTAAGKEFSPSVKYPIIGLLKERGGVRVGSTLAGELAARDITPKTFPGLFVKEGGIGDLDNIDSTELPHAFRAEYGYYLGMDTQGYADPIDLYDALDREMNGQPVLSEKDKTRADRLQASKELAQDVTDHGIDPSAPDAFEQYQALKERDNIPQSDTTAGTDNSEIDRVLKDVEFYDRATEALPAIENSLKKAFEAIDKMPEAKKAKLIPEVKAFEAEIEVYSKDIKAMKKPIEQARTTYEKADAVHSAVQKERGLTAGKVGKRGEAVRNRGFEQDAEIAKRQAEAEHLRQIEANTRDQIEELINQWDGNSSKAVKKLSKGKTEGADGKLGDEINTAIKKILNARTDLSREELENLSAETKNRILASYDGMLPYEYKTGSDPASVFSDKDPKHPSALKNRAFQIPVETALQNKFLVTDAKELTDRYIGKIVPWLHIMEEFGDSDLTKEKQQINYEFDQVLRKMPEGTPDEQKSKQKVEALRKQTIGNLNVVLDRLLKRDQLPTTERGLALNTLGRNIRKFNILTMMGSCGISNLPDIAGLHLAGSNVFKDAIKPMMDHLVLPTDRAVLAQAMREYHDLGVVAEIIHDERLRQLGDVMTDPYNKGQIELLLDKGLHYMPYLNGIKYLNEMTKQLTCLTLASRWMAHLEDYAAGTADHAIATELRSIGFTPELARRIADQNKQFGTIHKGLKMPNAGAWTDAEARDAWANALIKEVDRIILEPGLSKSKLFNDNEFMRLVSQFRGFTFNATSQILLRNIQQRDPRVYLHLVSAIGLGALVYKLKMLSAGKDTSDKPGVWMAEALDRSGALAGFMEYANTAQKITGGAIGVPRLLGAGKEGTSRMYPTSVTGSVLGPTIGQIQNLGDVMHGISGALSGTGEFTDHDKFTTKRLIPFNGIAPVNVAARYALGMVTKDKSTTAQKTKKPNIGADTLPVAAPQ